MNFSFQLPTDDDRGVSPVIGVILMVAVTVILAAVIASFVLGFGSGVSENVQAGADIAERDDGTVRVTWISEGNAASLNVTAGGSDALTMNDVGDTISVVYNSSQTGTPTVDTATNTIYVSSDSATVTVTAIGSGGAKTVVGQKEVTLEDQA